MKKELSEMTLEELWKLFPVFLTAHKSEWHTWYEEEYENLITYLPEQEIFRMSHIGSTAIAGIWAKPIIDILVEVNDGCSLIQISEILQKAGYLQMNLQKRRISLNKGYTPDGFAEKVFHLHLRYEKDNDELYFRDYLNENVKVAKEYEALKLALWPKYEHDRDGYTNSKTEFVNHYTEKAKTLYRGKYGKFKTISK